MRLHSHSWIIIWSKHRRKWNQGIFSFCCLEVIWLFMQSRGFTPFCSYNTLHQIPEDALAKSCQISLRPLSTALTLSFFVLCILFRVLGGLVSNCPCQFSRSLPDFHFSKIEWLSLLSLPKESSPWLENPESLFWPHITLHLFSLPFLQSSRNYSFVSSFTVLGRWRGGVGTLEGVKWLNFAHALYQCYVITKHCYSCCYDLLSRCLDNQASWLWGI